MSALARRPRRFLDTDRPLLFAHRGGGKLWPENTLPAFEQALALGVRFLETDVHATRDGVLVLHHDDRVDRTTDGTGRLQDFTHAELSRLDAGHRFTPDGETFPFRGKGLTIPRLADVFALSPHARLNVEIKPRDPGVAEQLWEFVDRSGLHDRILVAAENDAQVQRFRQACGGRVATSAGYREAFTFWAATRTGLDRLLPLPFDALQVPVLYKGFTIVDPRLIRAAHRHGLQVHVWTVDETHEMGRLLNLGVDGLMSDRPDRLATLSAVLSGRGAARS